MLKIDYNNMTIQTLGKKNGIDVDKSVKIDKSLIENAFQSVHSTRGQGMQEWMDLPYVNADLIEQIKSFTAPIKDSASDFVVFGIGGSALGIQSVATGLIHQRHNSLSAKDRKCPRLFVEDNIDPNRFLSLLDCVDIDNAYFNVITKSGETSETLAQFLCIYDLLIKRLGRHKAVQRIIITTTIGKGSLYKVAMQEGFKVFGIGQGVGGRFSVLSVVGLVTFGVLGFDINQLLLGARQMTERCFLPDIYQNPALMMAYLQVCSIKSGKNISVFMPYADGLKFIADFYSQLWGESLGKKFDMQGNEIYAGQTPMRALGVTDQHSQIQLFVEGPFDKVVTFLTVKDFGVSKEIPKIEGLQMGDFLSGHTLNDLLDAERIATEWALTKNGRANFNVILPKIDEYSIGELLAYLMMQTCFVGSLLNINTYDQPGVEHGKIATFARLGRQGYDRQLREMEQIKKMDKYTI
ncbi:MAG: glucose-6-phosphate isomerase [Clostridiales bacterium]|jgi:glucose-6-phosphate isomerase|nr:glucose-6-phosphate isomerase [Clostridiales bacterium]